VSYEDMKNKETDKMGRSADATEPELITIVEGPPPEFQAPQGAWPFSLAEGVGAQEIAVCQTRTLKGAAMIQRCRLAWDAGRPVRLDFPDAMGLRHQVDIVAIRYQELPEGTLLYLWIRK
jgi:hypothetical protein